MLPQLLRYTSRFVHARRVEVPSDGSAPRALMPPSNTSDPQDTGAPRAVVSKRHAFLKRKLERQAEARGRAHDGEEAPAQAAVDAASPAEGAVADPLFEDWS